MGFNLGSIIATARNAITPLNEVMGAKAAAQNQGNKDQIALALQKAQLDRQMDEEALKRELTQAQIGYYGARAKAAGEVPLRPITGADNSISLVPTKGAPGDPFTPIATGLSAPPKAPPRIDPNSPEGISAAEKKADHAAALRPPPQEPLVQVQQPDGSVVYVPRSQAANQQAPQHAGMGGGMGQLTPQALEGMEQQAADADRVMSEFEARYAQNPKIVGTGSGIAGAAANSDGKGLMGGVTRVLGNTALAAMDPDYQRYVAAQKRFGNIMGNLMSRRYTEYQGILDTDLSGLAPGDLQNTLALKQTYRKDLLTHFPTPATSGAPRGASSGNIDLSAPAPKASKAAKPKKDYGIFGGPSDDNE